MNKEKIILAIILLISVVFSSFGQNIKYRDVKDNYTTKEYRIKLENQRYSPVLAGVFSYVFTGMGHVYVGEPLRGACFFCGELIATGAAFTGLIMVMTVDEQGCAAREARPLLYSGFAASVLINVWGILDVIKVAKIKNIALSEMKESALLIQFQPYINYGNIQINSEVFVYGATVSLVF